MKQKCENCDGRGDIQSYIGHVVIRAIITCPICKGKRKIKVKK